ncbi:polysaccharide deacetylase family protein [Daejeonella lutea]|uniref:Polysaccharide deacetylase n=1 Tax=Daejeonella lutea TaxID=572036 RepID=A0A1T5F5Y8_9SPHI|nr:polysaccharide deacetylase family protein [Daejeonella lutea]SKB91595.1 Polysaccharide deacetylase [Daejeonella lutea]
MIKRIFPLFLAAAVLISACQSNSKSKSNADSLNVETVDEPAIQDENTEATAPQQNGKVASAAEILARPQVPILCYHQIRNWTASDGKVGKDYIVPTAEFKSQMKMLADSGYNTILPDQLYNYLAYGAKLPKKPIMLTFDDTKLDQWTVAIPEMKKYGFKGVFFIMTVSLGRPNYLSKDQVKQMSDAGHVIGSHTYDHQNVKKYQGEDWVTQIEKPTKTLKEVTGKDIKYFAYPFGLWNKEAIPELKKRGFSSAFILAEKRDENDPLFTVRRIIASGYWNTKTLHNSIVKSF